MSNISQRQKSKGLIFAEKQLKRHGWKKGKGLGKKENGISEAIKVKVKCDTAGDGVKVKRVSKQDGMITNKKPRQTTGGKDMLYGRFVKAATLTSGGEEPLKATSSSDSSEEDEEEKLDLSTARRLTDEELVQACGGRTAHKGARHGLTMSAKLARLEEQEAAFLASYRKQDGVPAVDLNSSSQAERWNPTKRKKRKKGREREVEDAAYENGQVAGEAAPLVDQEEKKAKKRKKKEKKRRLQQEGEGAGE